MKIFIDNGSTVIKMTWQDSGEQRTLRSPSGFMPEWSTPFSAVIQPFQQHTANAST